MHRHVWIVLRNELKGTSAKITNRKSKKIHTHTHTCAYFFNLRSIDNDNNYYASILFYFCLIYWIVTCYFCWLVLLSILFMQIILTPTFQCVNFDYFQLYWSANPLIQHVAYIYTYSHTDAHTHIHMYIRNFK